jgi:hypothetical protein
MDAILGRDVVRKIRSAANHPERRGGTSPLGVTVIPGGINFGVSSRNA